MRGKVGGLSPPYFKSRGAIAPLAPLLPPPLLDWVAELELMEDMITDEVGENLSQARAYMKN